MKISKSTTTAKRTAGVAKRSTQDVSPALLSAAVFRDSEERLSQLACIESRHESVRDALAKRLASRRHERRDRMFDQEIIIHAMTCQTAGRPQGAWAYSAISDDGFDHSGACVCHLTDLELQIEGLIRPFHELKEVMGRVTVYATAQSLVFHLTQGGIRSWRRYGRCDGSTVPGNTGFWELLFGLFDERQAAITQVEPGSSPAIRYCERLAKMCVESGHPYAPSREDIIRSLQNS
jgi:hypothetical protein